MAAAVFVLRHIAHATASDPSLCKKARGLDVAQIFHLYIFQVLFLRGGQVIQLP